MKKTKRKNKMQFCTVALVLLLTSFLLFRSKDISKGIVQAVDLCLYTVFPSLFGMMIVSNLIISSKIFTKLFSPFSVITRYLFKLPQKLTSVLLLSFIGGYPVGAKMINTFYQTGEIDRKTAERMLSFCVNAGPAFIVSAVSIPIFHNTKIGFLILAAHLCSNIIIALLSGIRIKTPTRVTVKQDNINELPLTVRIVNSVNSAIRSMIIVCSFIIAFSILLTIIKISGIEKILFDFFSNWIGAQNAQAIVFGVLEVTQGCCQIAGHSTFSVYLFAGITSFGGICVHMQIAALLSGSGISMKRYFFSRVLHLPLSLLFLYLMSNLWQPALEVFAPQEPISYAVTAVSPYASFFLIVLCLILLFTTGKSDTINIKERSE